MATPSPAELGRELNDLALAGEGWTAIVGAFADAVGRPARVIGVHGGVLASSDGSDTGLEPGEVAAVFAEDAPVRVTCADGWDARAIGVRAGPRRVGLLLLGEPVSDEQLALLDAAGAAVAIEAVRRDAVAVAMAESAGRVIEELRYGTLRAPEEVVRVAERFGLALDAPHAAAVFAYGGENQRTWATALSWIEMPMRQEGEEGWTILTGNVGGELTRIRQRLQGMVGEGTVLAAAGPVVTGVTDTARSFREAEAVLALLRRRRDTTELSHAALGLTGLLLAVPPERLRAYIDDHLGPILGREDLLATLEAWLATNGSRAAVAAMLDVHRNSVGYRMGKVRQLLDLDPFDPDAALHLRAALAAREVLLSRGSGC